MASKSNRLDSSSRSPRAPITEAIRFSKSILLASPLSVNACESPAQAENHTRAVLGRRQQPVGEPRDHVRRPMPALQSIDVAKVESLSDNASADLKTDTNIGIDGHMSVQERGPTGHFGIGAESCSPAIRTFGCASINPAAMSAGCRDPSPSSVQSACSRVVALFAS